MASEQDHPTQGVPPGTLAAGAGRGGVLLTGNILAAAAVFAAGLVLASAVLTWGLWRAAGRLESAVQAHGQRVEAAAAGGVGEPIRGAMTGLARSVDGHAGALRESGQALAHPQVTMQGPVPIQQPVRIQGTEGENTPLTVEATIGK